MPESPPDVVDVAAGAAPLAPPAPAPAPPAGVVGSAVGAAVVAGAVAASGAATVGSARGTDTESDCRPYKQWGEAGYECQTHWVSCGKDGASETHHALAVAGMLRIPGEENGSSGFGCGVGVSLLALP